MIQRLVVPASVFVLLSACVEVDAPEMGTTSEALGTYCVGQVAAAAPVPQSSPWWLSPPDVPGQVWVSYPTDKTLATYALAQVNLDAKTVPWRTTFSANQRAFVLALVGARPGVQISIRNPPPPPPPDGDGFAIASQYLTMALTAQSAGNVEAAQPPQ